MARKVALLEHFQDPQSKAGYWLKRKQVDALLASGKAVRIDHWTVQMVGPKTFDPGDKELSSGQASAYERACILGSARQVNGGLTRTETQPAKFQRFKGARVAH